MMIPKNIYKSLCVFALCGLLLSCAAGRKTVSDETGKTDQPASTRGFNPLELPADKTIVPKSYPRTADLIGNTMMVSTAEEDSLPPVIENIPEQIDSLNSQAYRVQLFSTKVYGEARKELKIAEEIFDRPLFMDYEVPYYKLRVGNFSDKEQAEQYQQKAKAAGYQNAWIVMVTVNIQQTQPLYDDNEMFLPLPDSTTADSTGEIKTDDNLE